LPNLLKDEKSVPVHFWKCTQQFDGEVTELPFCCTPSPATIIVININAPSPLQRKKRRRILQLKKEKKKNYRFRTLYLGHIICLIKTSYKSYYIHFVKF